MKRISIWASSQQFSVTVEDEVCREVKSTTINSTVEAMNEVDLINLCDLCREILKSAEVVTRKRIKQN